MDVGLYVLCVCLESNCTLVRLGSATKKLTGEESEKNYVNDLVER